MGMGNPLLDISANVEQEFLDKYDVKLDSAILAEEKHQPLFKELVESYKPTYIAGGATQNSIRVGKLLFGECCKNLYIMYIYFSRRTCSSMDDAETWTNCFHGMCRK